MYMSIDVVLGVLVTLSAVWGFWRGLVKETIALLTWISAVGLGLNYQDEMGYWLPTLGSKVLESVMSFAVIFITVFTVGLLIRFFIRFLIVSSGFSIVDRFLGGLFGLMRGALIASVIVSVGTLLPSTLTWPWSESLIAAKVGPVVEWMQTFFHIDESGDMAFTGLETLEQYLRG